MYCNHLVIRDLYSKYCHKENSSWQLTTQSATAFEEHALPLVRKIVVSKYAVALALFPGIRYTSSGKENSSWQISRGHRSFQRNITPPPMYDRRNGQNHGLGHPRRGGVGRLDGVAHLHSSHGFGLGNDRDGGGHRGARPCGEQVRKMVVSK